ncbi:MAG: TatD family hydrolase [Candidatus Micrarchaeia archaeon]
MQNVEFADAHCHLNLFEDPAKAVEEAIAAGVGLLVCSGDSAKDNTECLKIAEAKHVFSTIGIGPDFACKDLRFIDSIKNLALANKPKVVGIGEIGLDTKIADQGICDMKTQEAAFVRQTRIAKELQMPAVIHARGALDLAIEILVREAPQKAMFHFFEGNAEQALYVAEKGYLVSLPPFVNRERKRIISTLDIKSIVVETDSPVAGKSPQDVIKLVNEIAKIKNIDAETAARKITQNIRNLFSIY